jgi:predicted flap endonuclease-1-like 5' DNA nuclease
MFRMFRMGRTRRTRRMVESVAPSATDPIPAIRFMSFVGLAMLAMTVLDAPQELDRVSMAVASPWPTYRIDPANALAAEWTLVPGIGPAMARRLERHRSRGGFDVSTVAAPEDRHRTWDLQAVSGIGPIAARRAAPFLVHPALSGRSGVIRGTSIP